MSSDIRGESDVTNTQMETGTDRDPPLLVPEPDWFRFLTSFSFRCNAARAFCNAHSRYG